jgi:hypothetical protein
MNADHPCHGTGVDPEARPCSLTVGDRAKETDWRQNDQGGQQLPGGARPCAEGDPAKRLREGIPKAALETALADLMTGCGVKAGTRSVRPCPI